MLDPEKKRINIFSERFIELFLSSSTCSAGNLPSSPALDIDAYLLLIRPGRCPLPGLFHIAGRRSLRLGYR
jgi:hypothetical protein